MPATSLRAIRWDEAAKGVATGAGLLPRAALRRAQEALPRRPGGRRPRHKGRRKGCLLHSPHPPPPPSRMSGCGRRSQAFWVAQRRKVKHTVSHRAPSDTPAQPHSLCAPSVCAHITTWRSHKSSNPHTLLGDTCGQPVTCTLGRMQGPWSPEAVP